MKKKIALFLLVAGLSLASFTNVNAKTDESVQDVTYVETTDEQLNDEEWERENDPLYEKYANEQVSVYSRSISDLTSAKSTSITGSSNIEWGKGLTHDPQFDNCKKVYGIDVSKWQKTIDWKAVKDAGVEFAIIRLGYRAQASGTLTLDECFDQNIQGAHDAGIKIGVYFYTQAITTKEAKAEAQFCVEKLTKYPGYLSFPIMYDIENTSTDRMGKANVTTAQRTSFCQAFCDEAIASGYKSGVYASLYYFKDKLQPEKFSSEYHNWLARYSKAYNTNGVKYEYPYEMWQYSDGDSSNKNIVSVKIPGISGNVDLDVYYAQTPDKVTDLKQSSNTADSINLTWRKQSNVNGYEVVVYNEKGETVNVLNCKDAQISVGGLESGSTYKFRVRAYFSSEETVYGSYSETVTTTTKPAKVEGISEHSYTATCIKIQWKAVNGATSYKVYKYNSSNKKYELLGTTSSTIYKVSGLKKNTKYYFKVVANRTLNDKSYDGAESTKFQAATKPDKTEQVAKKNVTTTAIRLTWKKQSGVSAYEIACYDNSNKLIKKVTTSGNTNTIAVNKLNPGVTYRFKVRSYIKTTSNAYVYGVYSSDISMTTKPAKVTNLDVSVTTRNSVTLSWDKVTGASGYKIYSYNTKTKKYKLLATTKKLSYKVTKLSTAQKYTYKVQAYRTFSKATYEGSKSDSITVSTAPDVVTGIKQTQRAPKAITITWKKVKGATGYRVYRYDMNGKLLAKFDTKTNSFKDRELEAGKYIYKVRAYVHTNDHDSFGSYSKAYTGCTKAWKVSGIAVNAVNDDSVTIQWTKQSGVSGYEIYLYDEKTDSYKLAGKTKSYKYKLNNLKADKTYKIKIRGYVILDKKNYYGAMSNEFEFTVAQ